jgi:dipicolinate synthase subunit A
MLKEEIKDVRLTGFSAYETKYVENTVDTAEAINGADIIIGPIPFSKGQLINTPWNREQVKIKDFFSAARSGQTLLGGRLSRDALTLAQENGVRTVDILECEGLEVLNAIPTAEGAIQIAMENTKITIHSSNILVMGFGRIGKILCKTLRGLGANVYALARKQSDLSFIAAYGYEGVTLNSLPGILGNMDIIINTIPNVILDKDNISYLNKRVLIIELASKPFGVDIEESRKAGLNVLFAPSLPGKAAPLTSARYIRKAIDNIFRDTVD